MKKFMMFVAMVLTLVCQTAGVSAREKKNDSSNTAEVVFKVSLHCKNCVNKVEENLSFEKGVKDMKVSLAEGRVWIKYDTTKTDVEKLAAAIRKLGYEVVELK